MKQHLLVAEPHADGHRSSYVRWIVEGMAARNHTVLVVTTEAAADNPVLNSMLADKERITIHTMPELRWNESPSGRFSLLWREWQYWRWFRRCGALARASARIDAVVMPYLDYCFHVVALLGSPFRGLPWCAITMRTVVAEGESVRRGVRWRLLPRILRQCSLTALFVISPSFTKRLEQINKGIWRKLRYLADPGELRSVESRPRARELLDIPAAAFTLLVFGTIDERKGLLRLLPAVRQLSRSRDFRVLIVGRQSEEIRSALSNAEHAEMVRSRRLIILNRFVDDREQGLVFAASDAVWLGYENHEHMSGVMVLAGLAGLPIVATERGEIGQLARRLELGPVVNVTSIESVLQGLTLLCSEEHRSRYGACGRRAFSDHSPEAFAATIDAAFQ